MSEGMFIELLYFVPMVICLFHCIVTKDEVAGFTSILPIFNVVGVLVVFFILLDSKEAREDYKRVFRKINLPVFASSEASEEITELKRQRKIQINKINEDFKEKVAEIKRIDKKNKILKTLELTDEDIDYLKSRRK